MRDAQRRRFVTYPARHLCATRSVVASSWIPPRDAQRRAPSDAAVPLRNALRHRYVLNRREFGSIVLRDDTRRKHPV